jgi:cytosine deaminase
VTTWDVVLRDVALSGHPGPADVAITGGRIAAVGPRLDGRGRLEWDGGGRWVLPALVDPHVHLDKAFSLSRTGAAGDLDAAVVATAALRRAEGSAELLARGRRLLDLACAWGVGALRTQVNVDHDVGLRAVEAALALRDEYAGRLRLQVVAFASRGVLPGRRARDLLTEALRRGCDALGASLGTVEDPVPVLEDLLAAARGAPLDLHVDEHTAPRCPGLEVLVPMTLAHGYPGRVIAAHCCALSCVDEGVRGRLIEGLAQAQIAVVALPLTNLYLQGRGTRPPLRVLAPVRDLLAAGVRVLCGSDNVQDAFLPYGNGDPLVAAAVLGIAAPLVTDDERTALLPMVTTAAAAALGLSDYGIRPGARADLVGLDCRPPDNPVTALPRRVLVMHAGRVIGPPAGPSTKEGHPWTTPSTSTTRRCW